MKRCIVLMVVLLVAGFNTAQACTVGACVSAGARLSNVDSTQTTLMSAALSSMSDSTLNLTQSNLNTLAQGDVSLASLTSALQATTGAATPSDALNSEVSLSDLAAAMATAAQAEGNPALAATLSTLQSQLSASGGTIRLSDFLATDGASGETRINTLELMSGAIQLEDSGSGASTPTPITISGSSVGLGSVIESIQISAQAVEPPVYVCGPVGSQFQTGAMRVKFSIELVALAPDATALNALPGVTGAAISLGHLDLYADMGRATGVITAIDALANTLTVQATPGLTNLYLGAIDDALFFDKNHIINADTDLDFGRIGTLTVNATTVDIEARSVAQGDEPTASTLNFTGPYPQTLTASSGTASTSSLADTLIDNLQLRLNPSLDALDQSLLPALQATLSDALAPVLATVLTEAFEPMLATFGIRLGEVDVTAHSIYQLCTLSGLAYNDENHSARHEFGEVGTNLVLYAKLIPANAPSGPASHVVAVDTASGSFVINDVSVDSYALVINTSANASDTAATVPTAWIATEVPSMTRSVTFTTTDISDQNFGLYNGSTLEGAVFKDNGAGAGNANNGIQDGSEIGIVGVMVKVIDNTASIDYDTTQTGSNGAYTLWIPAAAGAGTLKIVESNADAYISVAGNAGTTGGSYELSSDSVTFTHLIGSAYSGVNFADVPDNRFDTDGQQTVLPGSVAFYTHAFVAGSAGTLSFNTTAPKLAGWNHAIYLDDNCNGSIDGGENLVVSTLTVSAEQQLCIVTKVFAADNAAYNTQYPLSVAASFSYANSALTGNRSRSDLTIVGNAADAGLRLSKTVDRAVAKPGDAVAYTITYRNDGNVSLSNLKIYDAVPAYTVFNSASCGASPAGSACNVSAQPTAGARGSIEWTFTGALNAGASGVVSFSVTVQ